MPSPIFFANWQVPAGPLGAIVVVDGSQFRAAVFKACSATASPIAYIEGGMGSLGQFRNCIDESLSRDMQPHHLVWPGGDPKMTEEAKAAVRELSDCGQGRRRAAGR